MFEIFLLIDVFKTFFVLGATAVDALAIGYRTILLDDCSRGVDLLEIEKTKNTVIKNNGVVINSDQVKAMVEGRDRRPELGYKLAMELSTFACNANINNPISTTSNINNINN